MKKVRSEQKIFFAGALALGALVLFAWLGGVGIKNIHVPEEWASVKTEKSIITKIIDGDTIVISGGSHVRLLGIDADEKGYPCHEAARLRLEELALNKEAVLEGDAEDEDQYGRKLRYVFIGGQNINEALAAEGLAVARFYPENQKYKTEIAAAEAKAIENKTGCKWGGQNQAGNKNDGPAPEKMNYNWQKITGVAIDPCDSKNHIGEDISIEGIVADAYRGDSDTVFLDFGGTYPNNCFAAVIFKGDLDNFSGAPETTYDSKTVRISGKVRKYRGKPEIIMDSPEQIEIGTSQ